MQQMATWEILGEYEIVWESMGEYGSVWECMGVYGSVWEAAAAAHAQCRTSKAAILSYSLILSHILPYFPIKAAINRIARVCGARQTPASLQRSTTKPDVPRDRLWESMGMYESVWEAGKARYSR